MRTVIVDLGEQRSKPSASTEFIEPPHTAPEVVRAE